MCRKSNAVWSCLLILFYFFLFKDNRSLRLQKWCVLWAGSIAWYIEKKKVVILLAGCKHLCDRRCAQSLSADTGKKWLLMFHQTLEVHIIALNFYDTWLCHIFMDKCNDGCPQKKKKKFFYDKMSREINCQKMTNCLVAKCALISVRYTFLTHSHTWEYKALREKSWITF